jgi:pyridoxal phosphate enzyme (YggS family)
MTRFQFYSSENFALALLRACLMEEMIASIRDNISRVEERIAAACRRCGRRREDIRLVAVSKTHPPESVRVAFDAGLRDFGENRVQEAKPKRQALADLDAIWHLVGHLQSNKARIARELFHWVHSIDSLHVADKLAQAAAPGDARLPVLIEVNLGEETSKAGVRAAEVAALAEQITPLDSIELRGLMVIPPFFDNPEDARPYFRQLRGLASELEARKLPNVSMCELSMGMSHDFEVAIEEGATIIRVGTAIFGERT